MGYTSETSIKFGRNSSTEKSGRHRLAPIHAMHINGVDRNPIWEAVHLVIIDGDLHPIGARAIDNQCQVDADRIHHRSLATW